MDNNSHDDQSNNIGDPCTHENHDVGGEPSRNEDLMAINVVEIVSKVDYLIDSLSSRSNSCYDGNNFDAIMVVETYSKLVLPEMESYVSGSTKIGHDSYKDGVLIESVSRISKLTSLLSEGSETNSIFKRTMTLMEEELRNILDEYTIDHLTSSDNHQSTLEESDDFPAISNDTISRMRVIATVMASGGYETECCQVYTLLRRNAFKAAMKKRGFQKLTANQTNKMSWDQLESHITNWTNVVKHTSNALFPREQELCSRVFVDYPCVGQGIITNLARAITILFLNFVQDAIFTPKNKITTDALFKVLEVHDALTELVVAMEGAAQSNKDTANELVSEILGARRRLGDSIVTIFSELKNSVQNDVAKNPVPNGAVHPLTRYTMNYVRYACDFKDTLELVFKENHVDAQFNSNEVSIPSQGGEDSGNERQLLEEGSDGENMSMSSPFAAELVCIMRLLDTNLDKKSKLYKDSSLRYIFLMNNGRYMLQKIKESSEMRELVGGISSRKRSTELRAYHKNYQRETWSKVLQCLTHQGIEVNGKVNKPLLKERLKNFNQLLDDILKTQSAWVVSDEQLQSELRVSISAVMIPAYRSFFSRFDKYLGQGKQMDKYVKYQPEDIEVTIDKLFDGNPSSMRMRK